MVRCYKLHVICNSKLHACFLVLKIFFLKIILFVFSDRFNILILKIIF